MSDQNENKNTTGQITKLIFSRNPDLKKKTIAPGAKELEKFEVMINPDSINRVLTVNKSSNRSSKSKSGGNAVSCGPEKITFSFILDGTNVVKNLSKDANQNQTTVSVASQIDKFLSVVYKSEGKPIFVVAIEYLGTNFIVQTESITISYSLFGNGGEPLRAKIDCSFSTIDAKDPKSPDPSPSENAKQQSSGGVSIQDANNNNKNPNPANKEYINNTKQASDIARQNEMSSIKAPLKDKKPNTKKTNKKEKTAPKKKDTIVKHIESVMPKPYFLTVEEVEVLLQEKYGRYSGCEDYKDESQVPPERIELYKKYKSLPSIIRPDSFKEYCKEWEDQHVEAEIVIHLSR